jgi:hypothetical protein
MRQLICKGREARSIAANLHRPITGLFLDGQEHAAGQRLVLNE